MTDKKRIKILVSELKILRRCANEALRDEWDRGNDGFEALIWGIDRALEEIKVDKRLEEYERFPLGFKLAYSFTEYKAMMGGAK